MTRTMTMAALAAAALFTMYSHAWAADYGTMSTEELSRLRGSMHSASPADRGAFHAEWTNRLNQMTPAERQNYMEPGQGMGDSGRAGTPGTMDHGNDPGQANGMGNSSGMGGGRDGGGDGSGSQAGGSGDGRGSGHGSGNGGGMSGGSGSGGGMGGSSGSGGGMGRDGGGMGMGN